MCFVYGSSGYRVGVCDINKKYLDIFWDFIDNYN